MGNILKSNKAIFALIFLILKYKKQPSYKKRTDTLLSLNRMVIHHIIAMFMSHCPFGKHAKRFVIPANN